MHKGSSECHIFTTLRYDDDLRTSPANAAANNGCYTAIYLLSQHFARLSDAANAVFGEAASQILTHAGISDVSQLERQVERIVKEQQNSPTALRIRLQIDAGARLTSTAAVVSKLSLHMLFPDSLPSATSARLARPSWTIVLDKQSTASSIATQCKTDDRSDYDRARSAAGMLSFAVEQEVLLFDEAGNIIDASITTPYFYRESRWVTPTSSCGGQRGTTRRWALQQGLCEEAIIPASDLTDGEVIYLSNGARGFFSAVFVVTSPRLNMMDTSG